MTDTSAGVTAVKYYLNLSDPLPKAGAVALVSVFHRESRLSPKSQGIQASEHPGVLNPSGAYGIASWNGPRQQALKEFCDTRQLPYDSLTSQLLFALSEIANRYPRTWSAIRDTGLDYGQIIPTIVREYENPKAPDPEIADATAYARALWPLVVNLSSVPPAPISIVTTAPVTQPTVVTMDPAIISLLIQVLPALINGILTGIANIHAAQTGGATTTLHGGIPATVAPSVDLGGLAPMLINELKTIAPDLFNPSTMATLIAKELAQVIPPKV